MGSYYKDAALSIAACHPKSGERGILAERDSIRFSNVEAFMTRLVCRSSSSSDNETSAIYIRRPLQTFYDMLDSKYFNPLELRGWVLQETALAPRTLHFTQEQMIWHCQTCGRVEADRAPIGLGNAGAALEKYKRRFSPPW